MVDEKKKVKLPHNLILENRKFLSVTGVLDVDSFDDQSAIVYTDIGELIIKGNSLHISKLNLDTGELAFDGEISSMTYTENKNRNASFLSKLFR